VTKLRDLERHLRASGCEPLREGAKHAIWHTPAAKRRTSVPRHVEIPRTTARAICRQLDVPDVE
jgi:predicted RNA binding protein YcfA (HicA-like mRNA interferase family)